MNDRLLRSAIRMDATGVELLGLPRVVKIGLGLSIFNFIGTIGALGASAVLSLTDAGKTVVFDVMQFLGVRRAKGVDA